MKKLNTVYLFLLIGVLLLGCQSTEELLPIHTQAERAEELMISKTGDENARKAVHTDYAAFLTGSEEVRPVNDPVVTSGSGTAKFHVIDNGNAIHYEIKVANLSGITAGHIHLAPFGENGPVEVTLIPNQAPSGPLNGVIAEGIITRDDLGNRLAGQPLDTLAIVMANGDAYVNIHTEKYPGGEVRGQVSLIRPNDNGNYNTQLSGSEEVPPRDSQGRGVAKFKFNADNSALTFKVNVANLENVRASHIHIGKTGVNGGVVVPLRLDKVEGPVNGVYAQGQVTSDDLIGLLLGGDLEMLREAIRTGNAYVNVHTDKYPPGEVRGQL